MCCSCVIVYEVSISYKIIKTYFAIIAQNEFLLRDVENLPSTKMFVGTSPALGMDKMSNILDKFSWVFCKALFTVRVHLRSV